ncbi:hypothetical protein L204_105097 [Cryptococcus depauperatus]|nr:hypothetical protein L204_03745 [Cryptococcus depauperatus CBS 7855]
MSGGEKRLSEAPEGNRQRRRTPAGYSSVNNTNRPTEGDSAQDSRTSHSQNGHQSQGPVFGSPPPPALNRDDSVNRNNSVNDQGDPLEHLIPSFLLAGNEFHRAPRPPQSGIPSASSANPFGLSVSGDGRVLSFITRDGSSAIPLTDEEYMRRSREHPPSGTGGR